MERGPKFEKSNLSETAGEQWRSFNESRESFKKGAPSLKINWKSGNYLLLSPIVVDGIVFGYSGKYVYTVNGETVEMTLEKLFGLDKDNSDKDSKFLIRPTKDCWAIEEDKITNSILVDSDENIKIYTLNML